MKNLILFITSLLIVSCADNVEYPSTYIYDSSSIIEYYTFSYENDEFVSIENSAAPEPNLSLYNTASIQKLEFIDDENVNVKDGFDTELLKYTGSQARIFMQKDGQRIELEGSLEGDQFSARTINSGDFDDNSSNVYISAICGEFVNCFDVNPEEWINGIGTFQNGKIVYVIIKEDILKKQ